MKIFGRPLIDRNEIKLVSEVLKFSILTHGKKSIVFEKELANLLKLKIVQLLHRAHRLCTYLISQWD